MYIYVIKGVKRPYNIILDYNNSDNFIKRSFKDKVKELQQSERT